MVPVTDEDDFLEADGGPYAVVGCRECDQLWIIDRGENSKTATCTTCGRQYERKMLRSKAKADEWKDACELRARILAARAGELDRYEDDDDYGVMAREVHDRIKSHIDHSWDDVEESYAKQAKSFADVVELTLESHREKGSDRVDDDPFYADDLDDHVDDHPYYADRFEDLVDVDADSWHTPNDDRPDVSIRVPEPGQTQLDEQRHTSVGPKYPAWMPDLLDALVDDLEAALATAVDDHGRSTALWKLEPAPVDGEWTDAQRGAAEWLADLEAYRTGDDDARDQLRDRLTSLGTGDGAYNAGLEALYYGPMRLLKHAGADKPPAVTLALDGDAWTAAARRTGRRALAAISVLGAGVDVTVHVSPGLEQHLSRTYAAWMDRHQRLAESRDTSHLLSQLIDDSDAVDETLAAQEAVEALPAPSKKVELLDALSSGSPRTVKSLREDPGVTAADGSIDGYLADLQDALCVYVEQRHPSNLVHLTDVGERVQDCITPTGDLRSPVQATLADSLGATRQPDVGSVCGTGGGSGPEATPTAGTAPRPEVWLADTGETADGARYTQFIDGVGDLSSWAMHKRYTAAARDAAVTLVDDRHIERFQDGKVGYLSGDFDDDGPDDVLVMVEWGRPLPTLGRIAATLLSPGAWGRFLTGHRLGDDLSNLDDSLVQDLDEDLQDILQHGRQLGWLSSDDVDRDSFKDRLDAARDMCMQKLATLVDSDDYGARGELFERFHGLITTATHLYHAAGYDVQLHVRIPDTANIVRDETRHRKFLNFIKYVVPKQTVYQCHSGYRMLLEDREDRLRQRLSYSDQLDPEDPRMDHTARVVVSGRAATEFRDDIAAALSEELRDARDAVRDGDEDTAVMELPVAVGNSLRAIEEIVEDIAGRKGFITSNGHGSMPSTRECARILLRALSTSEHPHRACPYAVAEAMLRMAGTDTTDYLRVRDLAAGAARLPVCRFFQPLQMTSDGRQQRTTPAKIIRTLLASSDPMRRKDILDEAGVSGRRYDDYIPELRALDIVQRREVEGRTAWTATLGPWWTPQRAFDAPNHGDGETDLPDDPEERDLLKELLQAAADAVPSVPGDLADSLLPSTEDLPDEFPVAERWHPFVVNALPEDSLSVPPPYETDADVSEVAVGSPPAEAPGVQTGLDTPEYHGKARVSGDGKTGGQSGVQFPSDD